MNHPSYSLTKTQKRVWFNSRASEQAVPNIVMVFELNGNLDVWALHKAIEVVVDENDVLKSTIYSSADHLERIINPSVHGNLEMVDLAQTDKQTDIFWWLQNIAAIRLNLNTGPLFYFHLIKAAPDHFYFTILIHPIIVDRYSLKYLVEEISRHYNIITSKNNEPANEDWFDFNKIVELEKKFYASEKCRAGLTHWTNTLKSTQFYLELPKKGYFPTLGLADSPFFEIFLDEEKREKILVFAQRHQVDFSVVLLAAYEALLYKYTDNPDVIINHSLAVTYTDKKVFGCLENRLPLRVLLRDDMTFLDLVKLTQSQLSYDVYYKDIQINDIVKSVRDKYDSHFSGVFSNTSFDANYLPYEQLHLGLVKAKLIPKFMKKFVPEALAIYYHDTGKSISFIADFDENIDSVAVQHLLRHYEMLLDTCLADPAKAIAKQSLLTNEEYKQVIVDWNNTDEPYPHEFVHRLFETQVQKSPQSVAIIYKDQQLTYAQLNEKANQLAHILVDELDKVSVSDHDKLVGICLPRSIEMVVCMLAILKTGAAYVPLDPSYPEERILHILNDAKINVVITNDELLNALPFIDSAKRHIICLDKQQKKINQAEKSNLDISLHFSKLAYIIYTSGSTGLPKGVMIEHRSFPNLVNAFRKIFQLTPEKRVLQFSSMNFDAVIPEIFSSLTVGATIYVVSEELRQAPDKLIEFLEKNAITTALLPPALLKILPRHSLPNLDTLAFGGDICDQETVDFWSKGRRYINCYGPTECTVCATYGFLQPGDLSNRLGRPLQNYYTYVLDKNLNPVPIGMIGELYIGGIGVGRGYINRPDMTAKHFIHHPFGKGTLYKTGDLVRYHHDGHLEYIGRTDFEVKIRGFRIQLNDIEHVLQQLSGVKQVTTKIWQKPEMEKAIAAYYILNDYASITPQVLREHLKKYLPEYMVPSYLFELEEMPLSVNGKINKAQLPDPYPRDSSGSIENHEEQRLKEIWTELFKLPADSITAYSDFFDLGGHSLLATQLASRIKNQFNVDVTIKDIFQHSQLRQIAKLVKESQGLISEKFFLQKAPISDLYSLSSSQMRLWYFYKTMPQSVTYNILFSIRFTGGADIIALRKSLMVSLSSHEIFRMYFVEKEGEVYLKINDKLIGDIPIIDCKDKNDVLAELEKEKQHIFDLSKQPLFHCKLLLSEKEGVSLLFNIHHILFDGGSLDVFMLDLGKVYGRIIKNHSPEVILHPIEFKDFAYSQLQWVSAGTFNHQLAYWQRKLFKPLPILELPTDFKRPSTVSFNGDSVRFSLPDNLVVLAKKIAATNKSSLFSLFLTVYYIFLHRITQQDDIIIASPIANRTKQELEQLVGLCANVVTYRTQLSNEMTFDSLLKIVNDDVIQTQDNQDLPFDVVVEKIQIGRDTSRNPIFQTMFVLQSGFKLSNQWADSGIHYHITEEHTQTSKFDITLILYDNSAENSVSGYFEFNADLFLRSTISRYSQYFINILRTIIDNPKRNIDNISLLSSDEYKMLVYDYNASEHPFPCEAIHRLFEKQASKSPSHTAIVYQEQHITYQELNKKANQLARYIRNQYQIVSKRELAPDTFIGLCMDRGIDMIIGILAILKSGAAYLPLDPNYPRDRLIYMLTDSNCKIILTKQSLLTKCNFLADNSYQVIYIDSEEGFINYEAADNLLVANKLTDLAYIIYTSGSTGLPKGVIIEHKGIPNLAYSCQAMFNINSKSKILQFASINFDAAVFEIFEALLNGAILYIIPDDLRTSPDGLVDYLENNQISIATLPPALLRILPHRPLPSLHKLCFAGDICDQETVDFFAKNRDFFNAYGPTETSVCATYSKLTPGDSANRIGKGLRNIKIYVLDKTLSPVPVGVLGELYVGGIGLARGYLNRPDLTVERFIVNPFSDDPAERIYKTGDVVRWRSDGELEYVGRADFQVQIRGFRVELGEIEELLNQHEAVGQAAVAAVGNDISKQLIACYTEKEGHQGISIDVLRKYLQAKLPDYMIPTAFIRIDTMPLSPSGKIDKKSLPGLNEAIVMSQNNYIAPRNEIEINLAQIWSDLFKYKEIGIRDNFFDLGGNSLLSIRMLSKVKSTFNFDISLTQFFQHPTIESMSELILGEVRPPSLDMIAIAMQDAEINYIHEPVYYPAKHNELQHILLTGANGFLGVHLLQQLLKQTSAKIYCLIRGKDFDDMQQKIATSLAKYQLSNLLNSPRVTLLNGDLSKPNLGMNFADLAFITEHCDSIYHNGSLVNHIYDYRMLKPSNVNSTIELIKIATIKKMKVIHYISTLSAASQFNDAGCALEVGPGKKPISDSGYILSKWVSERLLATAAEQGLRVNIFRPGNVTGHSQNGTTNFEFNHALLFLKSCIQFGVAPQWKTNVEMTPVDRLSQAIITLSLQPIADIQVFNMANPNKLSWQDYFNLVKQYGFKLKIVPAREWVEKYVKSMPKDNVLYPLRDIYLHNPELSEVGPDFNFENHHSQQQLQSLGIDYPDNYAQLVMVYLRYLEQQGFLVK